MQNTIRTTLIIAASIASLAGISTQAVAAGGERSLKQRYASERDHDRHERGGHRRQDDRDRHERRGHSRHRDQDRHDRGSHRRHRDNHHSYGHNRHGRHYDRGHWGKKHYRQHHGHYRGYGHHRRHGSGIYIGPHGLSLHIH